jgi:hypothetical protein
MRTYLVNPGLKRSDFARVSAILLGKVQQRNPCCYSTNLTKASAASVSRSE